MKTMYIVEETTKK